MSDADTAEPQPFKETPMPSRSAVVTWLLGVIVFGTVGLSALGLAGRIGWLADLCNHFRFQYALVLLVTTVSLVLLRSRRVVWLSLAGLVLNASLVLPLYFGRPSADATDTSLPTLRVMHFNVNTSNTNHQGAIDQVLAEQPDVLFLQEVNPRWLRAMDEGLIGYRQVASEARTDNFGIACYVKDDASIDAAERVLVIDSLRTFDPTNGEAQVPTIELLGRFADRPIALLSIHPLPPVSDEYARARNATLRAAGQWAASCDSPCVVVGDFNATPWSVAFADLRSAGGLVNSQKGFGRAPTWPAGFASLGMIPIDHLLHSEALGTIDRRVGEVAGSDHLPLIVDLQWRKAD